MEAELSHRQMAEMAEKYAAQSRVEAVGTAKQLEKAEAQAIVWDAIAAYHREQQVIETGKEKVV